MSAGTQLVPMQSTSSPWADIWNASAKAAESPAAERSTPADQPDPSEADVELEPMKSNSSPWTELFEDTDESGGDQPSQADTPTNPSAASHPSGHMTANRATARHD